MRGRAVSAAGLVSERAETLSKLDGLDSQASITDVVAKVAGHRSPRRF